MRLFLPLLPGRLRLNDRQKGLDEAVQALFISRGTSASVFPDRLGSGGSSDGSLLG